MKKFLVSICFIFISFSLAHAQPLSVSSVSQDELCYGANDGSVVFSIVGADSPFNLNWVDGPFAGVNEPIAVPGNSTQYTPLPPGTYNIVVTDALGATFPFSFTILPVANPLVVQINSHTDVGCGGNLGTAPATVTGGTSPYTYAWSPSGETTSTAVSLPVGANSVDVTDANGCTANAPVTITNTGGLFITPTSTPISCQGAADGTATITASNGILPYTYNWSNGAPTNSSSISNQGPGTVTCIVTDFTGCASQTQTFTFFDPSSMTLGINVTNLTCNNNNSGAAVAQVTGGTFPYTYQWGGGQTTNVITGLAAGAVTVTVQDAGGCTLNANNNLTEPAVLVASLGSFANASCFGYSDGQATINVVGGTTPYVCNWSNGSTGLNLNTLPQGNFNATVVDANGCTATQTVVINQPAALAFTVANSVSDTICVGQSAILTATAGAGVPALTFTWGDGSVGASQTVSPNTTATFTVTGSDGVCQSQAQSIVVDVHPPLTLTVPSNISTCSDIPFAVSASATGGDGNYTFTWDNGVGPGPGPFNVTTSVPTVINVTVNDGCGTAAVTLPINVSVNPNPVTLFAPDTLQGCIPAPITFEDLSTISSGSITGWQWSFGEGAFSTDPNGFYVYENAGKYSISLIATSDLGCTDTLTLDSIIEIYPYPVASFSASSTVVNMENPVIFFDNNSSDAVSYVWEIKYDSLFETSPAYTFTDTGTYYVTLTAINEVGCRDKAFQKVAVEAFYSIYIPNTFTPHDPDFVNDTFKPKGIGIREYEMKIYDRWGNRVFRTKNFDEAWNGTIIDTGIEAMQGNYIYDIFVRDANGKQRFYAGSIKLLK